MVTTLLLSTSEAKLLNLTKGPCKTAVQTWNNYWPDVVPVAQLQCIYGAHVNVTNKNNTWILSAPTPEQYIDAVGLLLTGTPNGTVTWEALNRAPAGNIACNTTCGPGARCNNETPGICEPVAPQRDTVCFEGSHATCFELFCNGIAAASGVALALLIPQYV